MSQADRKKAFSKKVGWRKWGFANWRDPVFLIIVLSLALFNYVDTATYREVYENPCGFCECSVQANTAYELNLTGVTGWPTNSTG